MPDLERFVAAQQGVYPAVLAELRAGRKASHWMWFVFPQIAGLGSSPMAVRYSIESLDEARDYLAHQVLGARLLESTGLVRDVQGRTADQIFGGIDSMKLRSSMTLFARAAPDEPVFSAVLDKYFDGEADSATESRL